MDSETARAFRALERERKQYKRQNDHIKATYDRVSVTLPKGAKDRITATGESVNAFINKVVAAELDRIENAKK